MKPAPSRMLYDFWPWPGVDLLNDKEWPPGVAWLNGSLVRRPDGVLVPVVSMADALAAAQQRGRRGRA